MSDDPVADEAAAQFQRRLDQGDAQGPPPPMGVVLSAADYARLARWLTMDWQGRVTFGDTRVYRTTGPPAAVRWTLEETP